MLAFLPLLKPPSETLFVYFQRDPDRLKASNQVERFQGGGSARSETLPKGTLRGLWLPSGKAVAFLSRTGASGFAGEPVRIRVSPSSRYVAFVAPEGNYGFPSLWICDTLRKSMTAVGAVPGGASRLEWIDERRLWIVGNGGYISTVALDGERWSVRTGWPSGEEDRRRQERFASFRADLDRREPALFHDPVWLSPGGGTLAAIASRSGGAITDRLPVRSGYIRRTFVGYDARALRRRIVGPTWDQFQTEEPLYAFAGWVAGSIAVVGPADGRASDQRLALYGPNWKREFRLPGLVGYAWSMAGNPGLNPLRGLNAMRYGAP